jgi:single-strand DNA-binding protein
MDINEVTLLGSIREISSIRPLKNGQYCCWLQVLTDVTFQNKDGTVGHNQATHSIIAYGKYADAIKEKASIDQKIFIQGRLKTNSWEYNGMLFQKTFIVLERSKLNIFTQNNTEGPESYDQREDMVEDEKVDDFGSDDDRNVEMEDLIEFVYDNYTELVDLQEYNLESERNRKSGWPYE